MRAVVRINAMLIIYCQGIQKHWNEKTQETKHFLVFPSQVDNRQDRIPDWNFHTASPKFYVPVNRKIMNWSNHTSGLRKKINRQRN